MVDAVIVRSAIEACLSVDSTQQLSIIFDKLHAVDVNATDPSLLAKIIFALERSVNSTRWPLIVLGLPKGIQSEIALFHGECFPGVDVNAYLKASPRQVIRRLITKPHSDFEKDICDSLLAKYQFSRFDREDWKMYFGKCSQPMSFSMGVLLKGADVGGFTDAEIATLAMQNPDLIKFIPPARFDPNAAVSLLISGRAESLWTTYDFKRLNKNHWRELLLHTNPDALPEAIKPFAENLDGNGFSDEELLSLAQKCHALINLLSPEKVPFNIAYELYLTGRADLLWKNYPFAMLDKTEWRKILTNPKVSIPDMFVEIARGKRFKIEELCDLAVKNERLLPVLMEIDVPHNYIIDLLLNAECDYLWAHYHFMKFVPEDWERLIIGLGAGKILRPNAMSALSSCKGITEAQATRIINKDTVYCPHLPLSSISPDMVVEILIRGKGYFLWNKYDFSRLSDNHWFKLLRGIGGEVHDIEKKFLAERASAVDNQQLNLVLANREELVEFVDQKYIAPELAVDLLRRDSGSELWRRFDFSRLNKELLCQLLKNATKGDGFPDSLRNCLKEKNKPLSVDDLFEIVAVNPIVVIALLSNDWIALMDDDQFWKIIFIASKRSAGEDAIQNRLHGGIGCWKDLNISKLKLVLKAVPNARTLVDWRSWSFSDMAELIDAHTEFSNENPHRIRFFFWKHAKSLAAMAALTVAAFCLLLYQNERLAERQRTRQYWNNIVANVNRLDMSKSYTELAATFATISDTDMSVISNDVFVKKAAIHLNRWKIDNDIAQRSLERLCAIRCEGWSNANQSEITNLIAAVEACEYVSSEARDKCLAVKREWQQFEADRERQLQCEKMRNILEKLSVQTPSTDDIRELERYRSVISKAKSFDDLSRLTSEVELLVDNRIQHLRNEEQIKSVAVVSNGVEKIFALLRNKGGFNVVQNILLRRDELFKEAGYDQYCRQNAERFEEMSTAVEQYCEMKTDSDEKRQQAKQLDEKFKTRFMSIDDGMTCSNLIAECEMGIEKAKRFGGWMDPIDAYSGVKTIVNDALYRDSRYWKLVDALNNAKSYMNYLIARVDLVKDCGNFIELRKLCDKSDVQPRDLDRKFSSLRSSYSGERLTFTYKFVGVIKLDPESPNSMTVSVRSDLVKPSAIMYTLWKSSSGDILAEKVVTKEAFNRYSKVHGIDYSRRQGTPLFVRSYDYLGEE